jgi:hypothetical protein
MSEHDSDDSESQQSSVCDDRIPEIQPIYSDFAFGLIDRKRRIQIDWTVQNVVSSNVATSPFVGQTTLNWRSLGASVSGSAGKKSELDCFILMDVPVNRRLFEQDSILTLTNAAIEADPNARGLGNMTR